MGEPVRYREDTSHLRPAAEARNLMLVYEPLDDLVTDEWLSPYCWGAGQVTFYPHYDRAHAHPIVETRHRWESGDRVGVEGEPYELLSARCIYKHGQWAMRWLARAIREG